MDINVLIDKLKSQIGLNGQLQDVFDDARIYDSIINKSLVEFNRFSGFSIKVDFAKVQELWTPKWETSEQGTDTLYCRIPSDVMRRLDSLGCVVKTIRESKAPALPQYSYMSSGMKTDLLFMGGSQLARINTRKPKFTFRAPDTIVVQNIGRGLFFYLNYIISIECTHPKNLCTITTGLESQFEELCRYDIMINLYNNYLKNLKIDMGSVSLDLQLDEFQQAESNRRSLLEQMRVRRAYDNMEIRLL